MATNIYVLRLSNGKFYVGKSNDVAARYQQHVAGSGSSWTRLHRPVAVDKIIPNASAFDEDKITKEYMATHGIDAVRGGAYVNINLDESQRDAILRELRNANNQCTRCGRSGHFVADCYAKTDASGNAIEPNQKPRRSYVYECTICNKQYDSKQDCTAHAKKCERKQKRTITCYRCGKLGHYAPDCYVKLK